MSEPSFFVVQAISKAFGGLKAVDELTFEVEKGNLLGLLGPNGSGKTTVFNLITGFYRLDSGKILLEGKNISGLPSYAIARRGIGRTFQITRVFKGLTALENLLVVHPFAVGDESIKRAHELLEFVQLSRLKNHKAGELSYGQQKLLEFARVLMIDPKLILLDEPTAGVNPVVIDLMIEYIKQVHAMNKTVLIVEHNMSVIERLCKSVMVMDAGKLICGGPMDEVCRDSRVIEAYLGSENGPS